MSADGSTAISTASQPIAVSDGFHCSDLLVREGAASAKIQSVQDQAVQYMAQWIAEWTPSSD